MATTETWPGKNPEWFGHASGDTFGKIAEAPIGFGHMKRKEDARFIRGLGNYCDDVRLPGMVHGALLRSPYAHARIVSIDTSAALAHPKVAAVVIAKDLETLGLAWMPTISYDTQAVLAGDKVRFHLQEVAFVIALDAYSAQDALQLIDVEYEVLPAIVNCRKALDPDAPLIRDDKVGQTNNLASPTWEAGDKVQCDRVFAEADTVVTRDIMHARVHPCPMETCGMVADMNPATGQLNIYNGNQAPHAHRTVYAQVAGLPEQNIRILCNDIGGGFGNKVPVYPGYVCAIAGSIVAGAPVKWMEDRAENLATTGFARDYCNHAQMCAKNGKITGLRVDTIADHGAFDSTAQPTKFPAGFFHIVTGSYDLEGAHCQVKAVYTNKAPGGVAYRCSFRITEAVYLVERMVDALAMEMNVDPVELRMRSFIRPEQFPYETITGWTYDSGDYHKAMNLAKEIAGYDALRAEQKEKIANGEIMGIGCAFFTEGVGAGPRRHMDILGLAMNDGAELRVHPSGKAVVSISAQTQGQGHETTFAQIVAEELGISPNDIMVRHGDTDKTPYGLGTYGSRSTPVSGGAVAVVSRKVRDKARAFAALMLETRPEDLAWEKGRWYVKGDPERGKTIESIAEYAYGPNPLPEGLEGGLDANAVYDPPNLTYPFGAYLAVVDIDPGTGKVHLRRFIAVDDCGVRINPMVVEGQIHGGLAEGVGQALMEIISFDEQGNCLNASFMDYLLPTALECPQWELGETVTPCPHHPIGAKGVGESPCVGSPPCIANAVVDGLYHAKGIKHMDIPCNPGRVWQALNGNAQPPQ
ncbi:MAG: aerobic carbon-monoxide dehydrogenase large subunit [Solirubrobacteraceae bacterium]|nr:aerobic carbon-monoxide dehydrogenase large subunit [Solirubrobacteraceae bacterium]